MKTQWNGTPLEQFFITGKKRTGAAYEQIAEYKDVKSQLSKPYSLVNTSKSMRIFRYGIGIGCFLMGSALFIGELTGVISLPFSNILFVLIFASAAFLFGVCSVWMGFLRSAGVIAAYTAVLIFLYSIYRILIYSFQRSLWVSASVIFLSVWLIIGIFCVLDRYLIRKKAIEMFIYPCGDGWIGIDLDLKELLPISRYTQFITVACDWEESPESLLKLIGAIERFSSKEKVIFCGFELNGDEQISLYFYDCKIWDVNSSLYKPLIRTLYREKAGLCTVSNEDDGGWNKYQTVLYPDRQILLDTEAENMASMLEDAGLDYPKTLRFGFTLLFTGLSDSLNCAQTVKEAGYRVDRMEDHTDEVAKDNLEEKFTYSVNISREYQSGCEHLKLLAADVRQWAERFNGDLLEWGLVDTFSADSQNGDVSDAEIPGCRGTNQ